MRYIKTYENIKETKYIGKYIVFYRSNLSSTYKNLYLGKVINITKRTYQNINNNNYYFIHISDLYGNHFTRFIGIDDKVKFFLENLNIIKSFDTKIEAKEFFNTLKDSEKYNL